MTDNNNNMGDTMSDKIDALNRSPFERHTQTMLGVVGTALLLWVGNTISDNSETLGRLDERVKGMETNIADFKILVNEANKDRYTIHDAEVDKEQLLFLLGQLDKRVIKLEEK